MYTLLQKTKTALQLKLILENEYQIKAPQLYTD